MEEDNKNKENLSIRVIKKLYVFLKDIGRYVMILYNIKIYIETKTTYALLNKSYS